MIEDVIKGLCQRTKFLLVTKVDGGQRLCKIIWDRKLEGYRFINLTTGHEHVCTCVFKTEEDAMKDLEDRVKCGLVKSYKEISL